MINSMRSTTDNTKIMIINNIRTTTISTISNTLHPIMKDRMVKEMANLIQPMVVQKKLRRQTMILMHSSNIKIITINGINTTMDNNNN